MMIMMRIVHPFTPPQIRYKLKTDDVGVNIYGWWLKAHYDKDDHNLHSNSVIICNKKM